MTVALVYFAIIVLAFFLLIVRPQRRRLAAHRALVSALEVGDEVVTTGGVFGTVRGLEDDRVRLEVAEGIVITVARAAIAQSVGPEPEPEPEPAPGELPADNGTNDD